MMIMSKWCYRGKGEFSWDNKEMNTLYRFLDFCETEKIPVLLTDWGIRRNWLAIPDITTHDNTLYAKVISRYIEHLTQTKKYTCIKYFTAINEPNNNNGGWEEWQSCIKNIRKEFDDKKISVKLVGSDQSGSILWHNKTVNNVGNLLNAYSIHYYPRPEEVSNGNLQRYFKQTWFQDKNAFNSPKKIKIIAEAGIMFKGFSADNNPMNTSHEYGIYMTEYAAQAANAGSQSILAWMLDDNSHWNFNWGMWKNSRSSLEYKPWFYPWSILTRYFRPNSKILNVTNPLDSTSLLAIKSNIKLHQIAFINTGYTARNINFHIKGNSKRRFMHYDYNAETKLDRYEFPKPRDTLQYTTAGKIEFIARPRSAHFFIEL